jgi:hypothetical protein
MIERNPRLNISLLKMLTERKALLSLVALFFALFGFTIAASSAQQSRITGRVIAVTPDRRAPVSGVLVSLRSEILPEPRRTVSDEEGNYEFANLIASDYTITVEARGFERYETRVSVQIASAVEQNIELRPLAVTESVTVTANEDELRRTESSLPGQITTPVLRDAPLINERFQDALPLLPGVVRTPDGQLAIKGARATQTGVLVSNLNVTDPVTGGSAINIPLEAVEEIQVYSNPYSAEFGRFTGAVTNIETRSGSNRFRYLATNFLARPRLRNGTIYGIGAWTPRIAVGGPIIRDRLFFFQTLEYRFIRNEVESLPPGERDRRTESFDSFTRIDYNINPRNRLAVSFSVFPQKLDFFTLNTFNPIETTANLHQRGFFFAANEQAVFGAGTLLQSGFSVKQFDVDIFGNGGDPYRIAPERNFGRFFNTQHRESRRYELAETLTLTEREFYGRHALRFGLNLSRTNFAGSDRSDPVRVVRADGTTSQLIEFVGSGDLEQTNTEFSLFVQDRWSVNRRLTLDLGLRFDRDTIGDENLFAPRIGFVFVPFDGARTIVRGGIGLFFDKIPLGVGAFEQRQNTLVTTFAGDGVTPTGARLFRNVAEDDFRNPRSVAGNIQLDRELTNRILLRLGYSERRTSRDFTVNPISNGIENFLLLENQGRSRYREFEVTTQFRFQERRNLNLSYIHSRATGDTNDFDTYFGNARNPIIRPNEFTLLPYDAPHRLLFTGNIGLPYDITLFPVVDWRSGFPFSAVDENQNFVGPRNRAGRFPTFFSLDLQVSKGVRIPVPNFGFIPERFRGRTFGGRIGVKIFNLTDHFNPRDVQTNIDSSSFGEFYNGVGRTFRMKFEFVRF